MPNSSSLSFMKSTLSYSATQHKYNGSDSAVSIVFLDRPDIVCSMDIFIFFCYA